MTQKAVMTILIVATLIVATLASGCTVKGPGVKVKIPGVEVGLQGTAAGCPPGQAKKGRC